MREPFADLAAWAVDCPILQLGEMSHDLHGGRGGGEERGGEGAEYGFLWIPMFLLLIPMGFLWDSYIFLLNP